MNECPKCHQTSLTSGFCSSCIKSRQYIRVRPIDVATVQTLSEVSMSDTPRIQIPGFPGMDNALNGGWPRGSTLLMSGGPGSGKTTLALQVCERVSRLASPLYVTTEQMLSHVHAAAVRLELQTDHIHAIATTDFAMVESAVDVVEPDFLVIDSLQNLNLYTEYDGNKDVAVCRLIVELSRAHNCAVLIVNHVTKGDEFAGPRTLEHTVDGMLALSFYQGSAIMMEWRVYSKYRFGPVPRSVLMWRNDNGGFIETSRSPEAVRGSVDERTSPGDPSQE